LQPPICGEDVAPALINKTVQKFMSLLIEKSILYCIISFWDEHKSKGDFFEAVDHNI